MRPRFIKQTPGEGHVQKEVVRFAEARGWLCRKMRYEGRRGCPDYWCLGSAGRLIVIEFKRPGKEAREQQAREIKRLRDLGFDAHVVDDIETGCDLFRRRGEHLV